MLALAMLVVLPLAGFALGAWYGIIRGKTLIKEPSVSISAATALSMKSETWVDQQIPGLTFTFKTPIDIQPSEMGRSETTEWRRDGNGTNGMSYLRIEVPKLFEPMSNFQDAELTVGSSDDPSAVTSCLEYQQTGGKLGGVTNETIHGTNFRVFENTDAAAGNRYYSKSYRTVMGNSCVAIEYFIHSSALQNYPEEFGLHEFNIERVQALLGGIVHSFSFK